LSIFNQDHHSFVAECCTNFPELFYWLIHFSYFFWNNPGYPNAKRQHNHLEIPDFAQSNLKILKFADKLEFYDARLWRVAGSGYKIAGQWSQANLLITHVLDSCHCETPGCAARWKSARKRGERHPTRWILNLVTTRLSIAANRSVVNTCSYSTSRIGLTTSRCALPRHARDLSSIYFQRFCRFSIKDITASLQNVARIFLN